MYKNGILALLVILGISFAKEEKIGLSVDLPGSDDFLYTNPYLKYGWEIAGLFFILVYIMFYYVGMNKNIRIMKKWYEEYESLLGKYFSKVGISANYGVFIRESYDNYRLFCSGSKLCDGMLLDFKLKKRQDLFSLLLDFASPVEDILSLDIPLNPKLMDTYVFALCRKRESRSMHLKTPDLKSYTHQVPSQYVPELLKCSGNWVVLSDLNDIPSHFLRSQSLLHSLKTPNTFLQSIHVSSSLPPHPNNLALLSPAGIRLTTKLPVFDRMSAMLSIMELAFDLITVAQQVHLSASQRAEITSMRQYVKEKEFASEHAERQEAQQAAKEMKKKALKEQMEQASPEAQRKFEEKQEKEEKKKKLKKRMKVVRA